MTRFNDSLTDTLKYVAEHGARFTWSDFKVVQTNENASYAWDTSSNSYKWTGTPTFSYRLDIDKNVDKIVFVNDGTLPDVFIMDDGVHGAVEYNANMASQDFTLDIKTSNIIKMLYYNNIYNSFLTINNVDYKESKKLYIVFEGGDTIILNNDISNARPINVDFEDFSTVSFTIIKTANVGLQQGFAYVDLSLLYDNYMLSGFGGNIRTM